MSEGAGGKAMVGPDAGEREARLSRGSVTPLFVETNHTKRRGPSTVAELRAICDVLDFDAGNEQWLRDSTRDGLREQGVNESEISAVVEKDMQATAMGRRWRHAHVDLLYDAGASAWWVSRLVIANVDHEALVIVGSGFIDGVPPGADSMLEGCPDGEAFVGAIITYRRETKKYRTLAALENDIARFLLEGAGDQETCGVTIGRRLGPSATPADDTAE